MEVARVALSREIVELGDAGGASPEGESAVGGVEATFLEEG